MPIGLLGNLFGSAITAAASAANTRQTNEMNYKIAQETNAANREMVEMQNAAAQKQADLAYSRSQASNQVNLMRAAGMSRAGAINALNGGGSYTPAPVNVSQDTAPTMQAADLSALSNIGQAFESLAQRKQQDKALNETKRQFDENIQLEKDKLQFEKDKWTEEKPTRDANFELLNYQNEINKALKEHKDENGKPLHIAGAIAQQMATIEENNLNKLKARYINRLLEMPEDEFDTLLGVIRKWFRGKQYEVEQTRKGQSSENDVKQFLTEDEYMEHDGKWFKFDAKTGLVTELKNAIPPEGAKIVSRHYN